MQADAVAQLRKGEGKLLEFCKKHPRDLEDQLDFFWDLQTAGNAVGRMKLTRPDILLEAAKGGAEKCANREGSCGQLYEGILKKQRVPSVDFRHRLFTVLDLGRRVREKQMKGNALMIIGGADTGKTILTDPLRLIFKAFITPSARTTAPLMLCRGHELFLWQDFRYNPGKPGRKEDCGMQLDEGAFNRLLEGQPTLVEVTRTEWHVQSITGWQRRAHHLPYSRGAKCQSRYRENKQGRFPDVLAPLRNTCHAERRAICF